MDASWEEITLTTLRLVQKAANPETNHFIITLNQKKRKKMEDGLSAVYDRLDPVNHQECKSDVQRVQSLISHFKGNLKPQFNS